MNTSSPVYIYKLIDPRTNEIRYVGKTNNPRIRLKSHCIQFNPSPVSQWIKELVDLGLKPKMEILETVSHSDWVESECRWIAYFKDLGISMLNRTKGGNGNWLHIEWTPEMRERMRQKFLARPIPESQRKQISKSLTGKKQSRETVLKRQATINLRRAEQGLSPILFGVPSKERQKINRVKRKPRGEFRRGSSEWKNKIRNGVNLYIVTGITSPKANY